MKRLKYLVYFEILLWPVLFNLIYGLRIKPYRFSILKEYYLTIFFILFFFFILNLFFVIKHRKNKIVQGTFLILMAVYGISSLITYKDSKPYNLHESKVRIGGLDYYLYSDHQVNDLGLFEVDYYLAHPKNDRYLIKGKVMIRDYNEVLLKSYAVDYNTYFSSENLGIFKDKAKNKEGAQNADESLTFDTFPYDEIETMQLKFKLSIQDYDYAFVFVNRANQDELIEVYKSHQKKDWQYVNTLTETKEIYSVMAPMEDVFLINYSSTHADGTMNLFVSDASFDVLIPVSVPFVNAGDVYLEDVYLKNDKLIMISSGPDWNYGNTQSYYESSDKGMTWEYIKTEER